MNRETQEFWGFNMLLIDDMNHRIHAFANAKYCAELTYPLVEGGIYIVDNFKVKDFLGDETYRPVRNKKHIFFTKDTKLSRATESGLVIEKYAFDLFHMTEIEKLVTDNRFLVDMVGYLKNQRPLITSTKNSQEKQRLKFDLVDGRCCVSVTLFDEFGIIIDKALQQLEEEEPIIIIISCARVSSYEGRAHLTNYPAIRIFINPDHYSVQYLINRCDEMTEMSDIDEEDTKQTLTVRDITLLTETHIQREVVCKVVIDKVNEDANCFRLETKCSDDTGSLTIVLPHAAVAQISQKTIEDLYCPDKEELGEQQFPPFLRMFEKQKYKMTVIIKEENVMKASEVYEATRIGNENESGGSFTPSSNQTVDTNEMSAMNVSLNEDTLMQALNTAKSTSKKVRARKLHAPVPFDEEGQIKKEPKLDKQRTFIYQTIEHCTYPVKSNMSKEKFDDLTSLKVGKFDWKIRVRVTRFWRGATRKGEIFKSFNIILLDDKNSRMHTFIPGNADDALREKYTVGKCYIIRKFVIQAYKPDDKFLCLANDVQLVFSKDTQIKEIQESTCTIENNAFDFYDHSELMELTKQTTHLADVIGIVKFYQPLTHLVNKFNDAQKQVKLILTDERSSINVTFWDTFAEMFDEQMKEVHEKPTILIIHSPNIIRLTQPAFQQELYAMDKHASVEMLNVARIISLGKEYIMASDNTGCIDIILNDQQVRDVVGKRAVHLLKQMGEDKSFPSELKALVNKKYTIKLIIKEFNVLDKAKTYFATNICTAFIDPNQHLTEATTSMQQQTAKESSSSYHLDMISNLAFRSPATK
ncbi:hypothetical protein AgCh_016615 [Apium graveolens]